MVSYVFPVFFQENPAIHPVARWAPQQADGLLPGTTSFAAADGQGEADVVPGMGGMYKQK